MKFGTLCLLFLLALSLAAKAAAQNKPPAKNEEDEVVRVDTELVEVPVVVTDRTGKPVLNLKQGNFTVFEDGKTQELADFTATNAPFEVALLLDTSGSTRSELSLMQRAAQHFIDSLRPGDRVAIVAFRSSVEGQVASAVPEVLTELTSDRARLRSALEKVGTSNGTPYYDSLVQIAERVFRGMPKEEFRGRRALVALTDGVDSTSATGFEEARELLEAVGISNYFIQIDTRPFFEERILGSCEGEITRFSAAQIRRYYRSFGARSNVERTTNFCQLGDFERLAISKKLYEIADFELNTLAKKSGGKVFPAADIADARSAFRSVAAEIGTKYSLGYYSSNGKRDGSYRKIRVELRGLPAGVQVRAREGYTAPIN